MCMRINRLPLLKSQQQYDVNLHLVGQMEDGAVAIAANMAVALCAERGAATVPAERSTANRARDEVPRPHPVGPEQQTKKQKNTNQFKKKKYDTVRYDTKRNDGRTIFDQYRYRYRTSRHC